MQSCIKELLEKDIPAEEKLKYLDELKGSIKFAENVINGTLTFCPVCKNYFMTRSFFDDYSIDPEDVCVYEDVTNPKNNRYETRRVRNNYRICPKGCRTLLSKEAVK